MQPVTSARRNFLLCLTTKQKNVALLEYGEMLTVGQIYGTQVTDLIHVIHFTFSRLILNYLMAFYELTPRSGT